MSATSLPFHFKRLAILTHHRLSGPFKVSYDRLGERTRTSSHRAAFRLLPHKQHKRAPAQDERGAQKLPDPATVSMPIAIVKVKLGHLGSATSLIKGARCAQSLGNSVGGPRTWAGGGLQVGDGDTADLLIEVPRYTSILGNRLILKCHG